MAARALDKRRAGAKRPAGGKSKPRGKHGGFRPNAGRKRGGSNVLHPGEVKLVELVDVAIKRFGVDDPVIRQCLETQLKIARGDYLGRRGRHIGESLRAVNQILDRLVGRPRERSPEGGDFSDVDRFLAKLVDEPAE